MGFAVRDSVPKCEQRRNAVLLNEQHANHQIRRGLIDFLLASLVFNALSRWLNKIGLSKLPSDFSCRLGGRKCYTH